MTPPPAHLARLAPPARSTGATRFTFSPFSTLFSFSNRFTLPARATLMALALAAGTGTALAQPFRDPAFNALYAADKLDEMDQLARQRLAQRSDDDQAVLAGALVAMTSGDAKQRETAIRQAEACLRALPAAAPCHYALGSVLGVHAMSQGMLKIVANVSRVKHALEKAVELAPQWYIGRGALVEFYALAPSVVGGSAAKAREVARAAPVPDHARVLEASLSIKEDRFEQALALLAEVKRGQDAALDADLRQWWLAAGAGLIGDGKHAPARAAFERLAREQPDYAAGLYGLGRLAYETGALAESIKLYEQAAPLKGADRLPLDYRAGIAQQALGLKDAARASFTRFVAGGRGAKRSLEDARKRLVELGGA
jgi:tetratricopeptide (TPR) repeat protein